ncbi:MAG: methylenetetrahydrofolate reductase [NAD(P)H] [Gemmatimonadaceae bacterium]|jgi:methylenetetrahydrofolate reductase (NADPH)|nr:methylenetetrahydrofolate reductase [NAD(P)H] [Gemmatimonadaceae bacterium]
MSPSILHRPFHRPLSVSFEFFPPKTAEMEDQLWRSVIRLAPMAPTFVSVTYGAGGSTRERTHATVKRIVDETALKPAAHLTCVAATKDEILDVAQSYWEAGVRHLVALRGDPPGGVGTAYTPHPGGYAYAADLVEGLRTRFDFEISVAAYPEMHPHASSPAADLDNLKRKVDAGATRAITQFFFENGTFLRFVEKARAAGISIPIVPGIMPVTNFAQAVRFAGMCGATVPSSMARHFEGLDDDPDTRKLVAATLAAEQCAKLVDHGITDFHFYTLNRADLAYAICHILGLRPQPAEVTA